jgi:hypothetical protein
MQHVLGGAAARGMEETMMAGGGQRGSQPREARQFFRARATVSVGEAIAAVGSGMPML